MADVLARLELPKRVGVLLLLHRPRSSQYLEGGQDPLAIAMERRTGLAVEPARDGQQLLPGKVYLGPGDRHLLLMNGVIRLGNGSRENRHRPSADVLFRSAAAHQAGRTVGALLTGASHDGAVGLAELVKAGGLAVVQNPQEAVRPEMPRAALSSVPEAQVSSLEDMPKVLLQLLEQEAQETSPPSPRLQRELHFALAPPSQNVAGFETGELVPLSCPECGGGLWRSSTGPLHYRCHTGHAFSPESLLAAQSEEVERALYVALRVLEERVSLLEQMGPRGLGPAFDDRLAESRQEVELLRRVLMGED